MTRLEQSAYVSSRFAAARAAIVSRRDRALDVHDRQGRSEEQHAANERIAVGVFLAFGALVVVMAAWLVVKWLI